MVERLASKRSVQHPLYSSLPYRPSQRSVSSLELSKGNSAPWTTGTSVRSAISVTRSACWVSSFTHWSPLTMVMPRTSNLSDCRKTRMACWSLVPGPRASWSTMTLIFWAAAEAERPRASRHANTSCHIHLPIDLSKFRSQLKISNFQPALEPKLEGKLNQARVIYSLSNRPKAAARSSVVRGHIQLWVIKEIEELGAEFQVRT